MATARCSPPRRRRGALLHGDGAVRSSLCAERPPARNPFSLLFSFFLFFSFPASSSLRTGDASKIVATSVPLASFDATRQPPLNCNLLTPAFLLLCPSISSRIQVKGKRTRKKEQKEQFVTLLKF
ncbi:uncharacterized protein DS421_17g594360 [Arachis hypogaea]|uniref:Uncharacterized protein n=1 Tax=Arachis hypogaea TaxID=3818 RepID=A0A445CB74_ARAHY|nr:uncharacterized protein DS421_17g594360 [Arachis hypogaea]RYR48190.1 hypothetical protein Ahy_A07g034188 isoform A [Arachis hypogaea]